jgi:chromosome segregation ATPase
MKAKKAKDLESELIDDILNDGDVSSSADQAPIPSADLPSAVSLNDETLRIGESKSADEKTSSFVREPAKTMISPVGVGRLASPFVAISGESALTQSENLRMAQNRIIDLERETERLRRENEQLAAAGETIRKRTNELMADNEFKARKLEDLQERLKSEKEILEASLKAKDRELKEIRMKIEEYEMRLSTNLQKIRVRERELENRLEIVRMESTALVRNKDEMILDLKRQIDQFNSELENYRAKSQELNRQIGDKQETLRRTVKALRLALTMLEGGGEENVEPLKKVK